MSQHIEMCKTLNVTITPDGKYIVQKNQTCKFGNNCRYPHTVTRLHELLCKSFQKSGRSYKDSMCNYGSECQRGVMCKFAHSKEELEKFAPRFARYGRVDRVEQSKISPPRATRVESTSDTSATSKAKLIVSKNMFEMLEDAQKIVDKAIQKPYVATHGATHGATHIDTRSNSQKKRDEYPTLGATCKKISPPRAQSRSERVLMTGWASIAAKQPVIEKKIEEDIEECDFKKQTLKYKKPQAIPPPDIDVDDFMQVLDGKISSDAWTDAVEGEEMDFSKPVTFDDDWGSEGSSDIRSDAEEDEYANHPTYQKYKGGCNNWDDEENWY